jgi:hypothetical protein
MVEGEMWGIADPGLAGRLGLAEPVTPATRWRNTRRPTRAFARVDAAPGKGRLVFGLPVDASVTRRLTT